MASILKLPSVLAPGFEKPWVKPLVPVVPIKGVFLDVFQNGVVDRVGGQRGSLFGTAKLARTGLYRSGTSQTGGYVTYPDSSHIWGQGAATIFSVVEFLEGASTLDGQAWHVLFEKPFTSFVAPFYSLQISRLPNTAGVVGQMRMQITNGGTRVVTTGTVSITAGRYAIVAALEAGRQVLKIFNDKGEVVDTLSNTTSGALNNYATAIRLSSSFNTNLTAGVTDCYYEIYGVDNRAWSDAEIQAFGKDPFRYVLKPAIEPTYFIPAAAGFSPYWASGSNVIMNNGSP